MSSTGKLFVAGIIVLATTSVAHAQRVPDTGGRAAGTFGGSFGDGGSTVAATGSAGIRFTRFLGVDFELMYVPDLDLSERGGVVPLLRAGETTLVAGGVKVGWRPIILPLTREARVIAFFSKMTAEFPIADRLWPYITGGGGAGHLTEEYRFFPGPIILANARDALGTTIFPVPNLPARVFERSEISLGLTVGGGVDVRVWRSLAAGLDVRYVRFLGQSQDLDLGHVSARLSYRF
jgi:opacity protein-like surface antigen